jgi:hypothetical protein
VAAKDAVLKKLLAVGVRPTELGKVLGVSKQQASMMLSGQRGISVWHLDAIADLLDLSVADLFRDLPRPNSGVQHASNAPAHQEGGATHAHDDPRILAEELRIIINTFTSALQDVASRLPPRVAPPTPAPRPNRHTRPHTPDRVRRSRKVG